MRLNRNQLIAYLKNLNTQINNFYWLNSEDCYLLNDSLKKSANLLITMDLMSDWYFILITLLNGIKLSVTFKHPVYSLKNKLLNYISLLKLVLVNKMN